MKLIVSPKSETPLYEQLYNQIVAQIVNGTVASNECLPSIRFVARELEISVIPVKAAYGLLEKDGYIYTVPSKGCFVAEMSTLERKLNLAKKKLLESMDFCKELGLSEQQILQLTKECCEKGSEK